MSKLPQILSETVQICIAIVLASIGLKAFLLPNGFLDGGVTGIAILLNNFIPIDISYTLPVLTIPFFVLGWFTVSKRILIKSIVSVLALALVIHFENFQPITDDKLLIAIFGGIFLGAGVGLAIKNGTVLDGTEILGIFLNEKIGFSIGTIILVFNTILFGVTAVLISVEVALYSILTFIVTGKVIDFVFQGFEDYVGLWVVSDNSEIIQHKLLTEVGTGITVHKGAKGYGSKGMTENIEIIQVILNRIDVKKAYKVIESVNKDAFIVEFEVNRIKGGVLRKFILKSKNKKLPATFN
ncbi:MAG: YitT family protein [Cyclobacteriaceae bacterium]